MSERFLEFLFVDSGIWLWSYSETKAAPDLFGESNEEHEAYSENWTAVSTLRGHLQDVIGLSWSPCSQFVISCSTDSTAIVFDVKKGSKLKMLDDHKGWVNGVAWDPLNKFVATISSDRYDYLKIQAVPTSFGWKALYENLKICKISKLEF